MKSTKSIKVVVISISLCILLIISMMFLMKPEKKTESSNALRYVKESFSSDIQELMDGKYENLIPVEFESNIESVEGIYSIEILRDDSFDDKTFMENLETIDEAVEKFFGKDIDKSFLEAEIYLSDKEIITIMYDELEEEAANGKLDNALGTGWLYGKDNSDGKYIQTATGLLHTWFSKNGLDTIHPSSLGEFKAVYPYVSGVRQEDVMLQLKDGEIALSEMEKKVLEYMNSDAFPLIKGEGIDYGIGEARVIETEGFEAVCFLTRRMYKGIPFEYGSNVAESSYIDSLSHDGGEITYVESTSPDTMLGFFRASGTVIEKEEITEMLTAGDALSILSDKIGKNSVYEVHGVEVIYRNCEVPSERSGEVSDILEPKWKIITINQNDDKYTIFYVDVVTGEITERFEYYYE